MRLAYLVSVSYRLVQLVCLEHEDYIDEKLLPDFEIKIFFSFSSISAEVKGQLYLLIEANLVDELKCEAPGWKAAPSREELLALRRR